MVRHPPDSVSLRGGLELFSYTGVLAPGLGVLVGERASPLFAFAPRIPYLDQLQRVFRKFGHPLNRVSVVLQNAVRSKAFQRLSILSLLGESAHYQGLGVDFLFEKPPKSIICRGLSQVEFFSNTAGQVNHRFVSVPAIQQLVRAFHFRYCLFKQRDPHHLFTKVGSIDRSAVQTRDPCVDDHRLPLRVEVKLKNDEAVFKTVE